MYIPVIMGKVRKVPFYCLLTTVSVVRVRAGEPTTNATGFPNRLLNE